MAALPRFFIVASICLSPCGVAFADEQKVVAPRPDEQRHIDVVFCIDRSGSMKGVIETAKQKVWSIVNQVAKAKPAPVLRIGLVGYGQGEEIMHQLDLTDDLDEVFKHLITYTDDSRSGDEFVGHAIHVATEKMKWSEGKDSLKLIYIVGNETARQGPDAMDYAKTAPAALAKGIQINAIYCGDQDAQSAKPTWREVARLAKGEYMEIAGDGGAIVMATPFDAELDGLNTKLNATYVAFGHRGQQRIQQQMAQDTASRSFSGAALADRAEAKASAQYRSASWDLVDAANDKEFKLAELAEADLPDEMKKMSVAERQKFIDEKAKERQAIQKQIQELAVKRQKHIDAETKKQGLDEKSALDYAVKESLRKQAGEKGFSFEDKPE